MPEAYIIPLEWKKSVYFKRFCHICFKPIRIWQRVRKIHSDKVYRYEQVHKRCLDKMKPAEIRKIIKQIEKEHNKLTNAKKKLEEKIGLLKSKKLYWVFNRNKIYNLMKKWTHLECKQTLKNIKKK